MRWIVLLYRGLHQTMYDIIYSILRIFQYPIYDWRLSTPVAYDICYLVIYLVTYQLFCDISYTTSCQLECTNWNIIIILLFPKKGLKIPSYWSRGPLAYLPQRRTAFKIQNGHKVASKWPTQSRKRSTTSFLGAPNNLFFKNGK